MNNTTTRTKRNLSLVAVLMEECKNKGSASGFDTAVDQECENLICTHPGENATYGDLVGYQTSVVEK